MKPKFGFLVIMVVLFSAVFCFSDVIYLKDGSKVVGKILSQDENSILVSTTLGEIKIGRENIQRIEHDNPKYSITMKDGSILVGEIITQTEKEIFFRTLAGELTIPKVNIEKTEILNESTGAKIEKAETVETNKTLLKANTADFVDKRIEWQAQMDSAISSRDKGQLCFIIGMAGQLCSFFLESGSANRLLLSVSAGVLGIYGGGLIDSGNKKIKSLKAIGLKNGFIANLVISPVFSITNKLDGLQATVRVAL